MYKTGVDVTSKRGVELIIISVSRDGTLQAAAANGYERVNI